MEHVCAPPVGDRRVWWCRAFVVAGRCGRCWIRDDQGWRQVRCWNPLWWRLRWTRGR